jgi:putative GTP pyrophosphokinase
MNVEAAYRARFSEVLQPLAADLSAYIVESLEGEPRIDRISVRAKGIERFVKKSKNTDTNGNQKYEKPLVQIQDQIGARVTVFYKSDVDRIAAKLLPYFRTIEEKDLVPVSEWEFGYFGRHYVCHFPSEIIDPEWKTDNVPYFFELQIKTLFQHAWSEANHDLGYKPEGGTLNSDQVRMMAFTSAQAWGADRAFDDLFRELHQNTDK